MHVVPERPVLTLTRVPGRDQVARLGRAEQILRRIEWQTVRRLDGLLQGEYRTLFPGSGLDLAGVREYEFGDDVRLLDWNVTARTGRPHVRQYHEDRDLTAWLLLDTSASLDFGTAQMRKSDLLLDYSAAMARLLTLRGNRVGAILFSGGVDAVLEPRSGRQQALAIVDRLVRPAASRTPGQTCLAEVLDRAGQIIRRRSLAFVVSDFLAAPGWDRAFQRLAQRHEACAVWLRDPREEDMPDVGPIFLEDAETGQQLYVDTHDRHFRGRFRALAERRRAALASAFARLGVEMLPLSTGGDLLEDLARFAIRRRAARRAGRLPSGAKP